MFVENVRSTFSTNMINHLRGEAARVGGRGRYVVFLERRSIVIHHLIKHECPPPTYSSSLQSKDNIYH